MADGRPLATRNTGAAAVLAGVGPADNAMLSAGGGLRGSFFGAGGVWTTCWTGASSTTGSRATGTGFTGAGTSFTGVGLARRTVGRPAATPAPACETGLVGPFGRTTATTGLRVLPGSGLGVTIDKRPVSVGVVSSSATQGVARSVLAPATDQGIASARAAARGAGVESELCTVEAAGRLQPANAQANTPRPAKPIGCSGRHTEFGNPELEAMRGGQSVKVTADSNWSIYESSLPSCPMRPRDAFDVARRLSPSLRSI